MKAEKKTKTERMTMKFRARVILNFKIIVAAVVGCCLMAAPLTRAYKGKGSGKGSRKGS